MLEGKALGNTTIIVVTESQVQNTVTHCFCIEWKTPISELIFDVMPTFKDFAAAVASSIQKS